jgi:hypothetical protein
MTAPVALIEAVRAIGGELRVPSPGRLTVRAAKPLPTALMAQLKAAKPALIELLSTTAPLNDAGQVRVAIIERDHHAPRAWADGLARLNPAYPAAGISPQRWLCFVDDCGHFLEAGWADRASALGWTPLQLFGADRERPLVRLDHAGLLWLVHGGRVSALSADTAIIETPSGNHLTYRRVAADASSVVLPWEFAP